MADQHQRSLHRQLETVSIVGTRVITGLNNLEQQQQQRYSQNSLPQAQLQENARQLLQSFIIETEQLVNIVKRLVEDTNGREPVVLELYEIIQREVSNLQEHLDSLNSRSANNNTGTSGSGGSYNFTKAGSKLVMPTVMSLAAAVKFYTSSRQSQPQHHQQQHQHQSLSSSEESEDAAPRLSSISQLSTHSQVTLDALAFAKQCTRITTLLKEQEPDRALVLNHVISLATFIKKLMQDDQRIGSSQQSRHAIEQFMASVRDIRILPPSVARLTAAQADSLKYAIQLLASAVKESVLEIKRSQNGNALETSRSSSPTQNPNTKGVGASRISKGGDGNHSIATISAPNNNLIAASSLLTDSGNNYLATTGPMSPNALEAAFSLDNRIAPSSPRPSGDLSEEDRRPLNYQHDFYRGHENPVDHASSSLPNILSSNPNSPSPDAPVARRRIESNKHHSLSDSSGALPSSAGAYGASGANAVEIFGAANDSNLSIYRDQPSVPNASQSAPSSPYAIHPATAPPRVRSPIKNPALATAVAGNGGGSGAMPIINGSNSGSQPSLHSAPATAASTPSPQRKAQFEGSRRSLLGSFKDLLLGGGSASKNASIDSLPDNGGKESSESGATSAQSNLADKRRSRALSATAANSTSVENKRWSALSASEQQQQKREFQAICDNLVSKGFQQTAPDTISLRASPDDDKDIMVFKNYCGSIRLHAVILDRLLDAFIDGYLITDSRHLECLLYTFRHFQTPQDFLQKLIYKFRQAADDSTRPPEIVHVQICHILQEWVRCAWCDFVDDPELERSLEQFVAVISQSKKIMLFAQQVLQEIQIAKKTTAAAAINIDSASPGTPTGSIISNTGSENFTAFEPHQVAEQLTLIDAHLLGKIQPLELLRYIWEKNHKSPDIETWVFRFNQVSYWIGTELCTTPILKQRIQVLENMIKMLKHLRDLNNFNGVMAVISGLNTASVRRLKKTWEGVSSKQISVLHEIEKQMNPNMNYQSYRDMELRLKSDSLIPFLGLYLKDLTFANDGNPKMLGNGLVNFSKCWTMYDIVMRVRWCQERGKYPKLTVDKRGREFCDRLIALPEKRLYNYSLLCEARPAQPQPQESPLLGAYQDNSNKRLIEKWASSE